MQPHHEPGRDAGSAFFGIQCSELLFRRCPVDLPGEPVQRVALVQHLFQPHPEKVVTGTPFLLLWAHEIHQKSGLNNPNSGKFNIV
jgi:hypothetical protein